MIFTTGSIKDVRTWFYDRRNPFDWLFVVVAGHLKDAELFKELVSHGETLDVVSGAKIAILLFVNHTSIATSLKVDATGFILPGEFIGNKSESVKFFRISELPKEISRESVISASQTISNSVCSEFSLGIDDIPAILILRKWSYTPVIVRTKGAAEVVSVVALIKELRALSEENRNTILDASVIRLSTAIDLEIEERRAIDRQQYLDIRRRDIELPKYESQCATLIRRISQYLASVGVPMEEIEEAVSLTNGNKLGACLQKVAINSGYAYMLSLNGKQITISERCWFRCGELSDLCEKAAKLRNIQSRNCSSLAYFSIDDLSKLETMNRAAEEEILSIAKKFERKFALTAGLEATKEIVASFLGLAKRTRDILSMKEKIKRLIDR